MPPELFDAEEAKAFPALHTHSQSLPETPSPGDLSLPTSGSIEVSIEAALSPASLASSQSQSSVGGGFDAHLAIVVAEQGAVPRATWTTGEFRDDENESVNSETVFGECDFYDSGGVGWERFGGDGDGESIMVVGRRRSLGRE